MSEGEHHGDQNTHEGSQHAHEDRERGAVIVDLGKRSARLVRQLRKGRGKLLDEAEDAVEELKTSGVIDASAQTVLIVVSETPVPSPPPGMPFGMPAFLVPSMYCVREEEDDDD